MSKNDPSKLYENFLKKKKATQNQQFSSQEQDLKNEHFKHFDPGTDFVTVDPKQVAEGSLKTYDELDPGSNALLGSRKKITYYLWSDHPDKEKKMYPIPADETVAYVARRIKNHNLQNGYTLVTLIGKCLVAGTKVLLADGSELEIEKFGNFSGEPINVPIRGGLEPDSIVVAKKFFKFENKKIFEIETDSGRVIAGTAEHPLLEVQNKISRNKILQTLCWTPMQDLAIGASIQVVSMVGDRFIRKQEKIKKIKIRENLETVYDVEVPVGHSFIANGIVSHNSGTGKSTLTQTIVHRLHKQMERDNIAYAINWYEKQDIGRVDQIIQRLEKGINRILVFEDASYGDRELSQEEVEELMAQLTFVRHTLQAKVIFCIQIHYSKALGPFLRDGDVTLLTSITPIEQENYFKLYGAQSVPIIKTFFRKYGSMNAEGFYYSNIDESNVLTYYTKRPFKLALAVDFGLVHFVNYPAEDCAICKKKLSYETPVEKVAETEVELYKQIATRRGKMATATLRQVARWFFYFKAGLKTLEPHQQSVVRQLSEYYENHQKDYENVVNELNLGRSVDHILRARGVLISKITNEEKRAEKRKNKAAQMRELRDVKKRLEKGIARDDRRREREDELIERGSGGGVKMSMKDLADIGVHNPNDSGQDDSDLEV